MGIDAAAAAIVVRSCFVFRLQIGLHGACACEGCSSSARLTRNMCPKLVQAPAHVCAHIHSHAQVMVFEGTAYVMPLLGAYLADSFWGRYRTILIFSTIYLFGARAASYQIPSGCAVDSV